VFEKKYMLNSFMLLSPLVSCCACSLYVSLYPAQYQEDRNISLYSKGCFKGILNVVIFQ
jgi:hypothetical protein